MKRVCLKIGLTVGFIYFLLGVSFLYTGHPYEDVFILFKYVENLAHGKGIVYYPGGPHAEGYVDFLWIVLLSFFVRLKWDVALGAIFLNSVGAGISSGIFAETIAASRIPPGYLRKLLYSLVLIPLFFSGALAGYGGFSTGFYTACVLLLFRFYISKDPTKLIFVPWFAILVSLIRADGLILGLGFTLITFFRVIELKILHRYFFQVLLCFFVGLVYFVFRYQYFGHLFPLPLYVKGSGELFKGWHTNKLWLFDPWEANWFLMLFILGENIRKKRGEVKTLLLGFIPLFVLFISFSFFSQWQNIHMRFQAPVRLVELFILLKWGILELDSFYERHRGFNISQKVITNFLCGIILLPMILNAVVVFKRNWVYRPNYLDTFSPLLAKQLSEDSRIALTEAGRLAYWSQSKVYDVHGLNTYETAVDPPSIEYLADMNPDVIMFQHGGALDNRWWCCDKTKPYVPLEIHQLREAVRVEYFPILTQGIRKYRESLLDRDKIVPVMLVRFLSQTMDYDLYRVLYHSLQRELDYWHIYAFHKRLKNKEAILENITRTQSGYYQSYAQVKGFAFSQGIKLKT